MRDFQTAPNKVGLLDQKNKNKTPLYVKHLLMLYQTLGVILHQKDKERQGSSCSC